MMSQWIITQYCWNDVRNFCNWKATKKLCKDRDGVVICDKKNLLWFGVGYDFYPRSCVISIWFLSNELCVFYPRAKETCWIKIISNPKPWDFYIYIPNYLLQRYETKLCHYKPIKSYLNIDPLQTKWFHICNSMHPMGQGFIVYICLSFFLSN